MDMPEHIRPQQLAVVEPARPPRGADGAAATPAAQPRVEASFTESLSSEIFGEDGLTVYDLLDVINPLQHIPLVSTIYRNLTGDQIDPAARLAGSTLFFGPIGAAAAAVSVVVDRSTGKDVGEHVVALFQGEDAADTGAMVADAASEIEFETAAGGDPDTGPGNGLAPGERLVSDAEISDLIAKGEPFVLGGGAGSAGALWSRPAADAPLGAPLALDPAVSGPKASPAAIAAAAPVSPIETAMDVLLWAQEETAARRKLAQRIPAAASQDVADATGVPGAAGAAGATGATAPYGGWFSAVMLSALHDYEKAASLGEASAAQKFDQID